MKDSMKTVSTFLKLFACATFASIPQIYADTNPVVPAEKPAKTEALPMPSAQEMVMVDKLLSTYISPILAQLTKIDSGLEELALLVSNSDIPKITKEKFMKTIKQMRSMIENINAQAFLNVDIVMLYQLLKINQVLMNHLETELPNGFEKFNALNPAALALKAVPPTLNLETIHELMQSNEAQVVRVEEAIRNVGVSKFNKAYRILDKYLIDPALNKGRLRQALLLASAGTVGVWFFYRFTDWNICGLRGLFNLGYPAPTPAQIKEELLPLLAGLSADDRLRLKTSLEAEIWKELSHNHQQTWFYNTERTGLDIVTNPFTGLVTASTYFLQPYYVTEVSKLWNWAKLKALKLHNKCMGGVYTQQKSPSLENMVDPKITFNSLVGLDHVKKELAVLVEYIKDPETFDRAKRTPQKGFLLLGPTRTGKSFSAKALAGELHHALKAAGKGSESFAFFEVPAAAIITQGLPFIMSAVKAYAPCVLFIDEIDMLGLQRAGGNKDLLAEVLTAMSGSLDNSPNKQIIILGATNKPENLDEALRQRGRFGTEIRFEYPSIADRELFIKRELQSIGVNLKNFDVKKLALESEGQSIAEGTSFEDLKCMITTGIDMAKSAGEILAQKHLEQSLNEAIRRIEMVHTKDVAEFETDILAAHQAGHALATRLLSQTKQVGLVTIRAIKPKFKEESAWSHFDGRAADEKQQNFIHGNTFTYRLNNTLNITSHTEAINDCKIELAGHVAEKILLGGSSYSYHGNDEEKAFGIAVKMVARGVNIHHIPSDMECKNKYFNEANALLRQFEKEVTELLTAHKDALAHIARELKTHKDLTGAQIEQIIKHGSLAALPQESAVIEDQLPDELAQEFAQA